MKVGLKGIASLGLTGAFVLGAVGSASVGAIDPRTEDTALDVDGEFVRDPNESRETPLLGTLFTERAFGKLAPQPGFDAAFVLSHERLVDEAGALQAEERALVRVTLEGASSVLELNGGEQTRIVFVGPERAQPLVTTRRDGGERLHLLDPAGELLETGFHATRYTRLSPSQDGERVLARSEDGVHRLIGTDDLAPRVLEGAQDAAWLHHENSLVLVRDEIERDADGEQIASRLVISLHDADSPGVETARVELEEEQRSSESLLRSGVRVSPDDQTVAVEIRDGLALVDLATLEVRIVSGARGPVGFTPDSGLVISYALIEDGDDELLVLERDSLSATRHLLPGVLSPTLLVTPAGNAVLVTGAAGDGGVLFVDLATGEVRDVEGSSAGLDERALRGEAEVWLVDAQGLLRVDLETGDATRPEVGFTPRHVTWLAGRDLLLTDDETQSGWWGFDPSTGLSVQISLED